MNSNHFTPKLLSDNLDELRTKKSKPAKKAFRKSLKRSIASVLSVKDYDSDSDVSDYDEKHYR